MIVTDDFDIDTHCKLCRKPIGDGAWTTAATVDDEDGVLHVECAQHIVDTRRAFERAVDAFCDRQAVRDEESVSTTRPHRTYPGANDA